jgi:RNA polymerase sigma-70 factor (ECF subfamily)
MRESPSDAQVIERVLASDTEAFGLLVDRYQDEFTAYAGYVAGSPDEAADIVQESLVRAYKALHRCKEPARFKAWLFRIVSNQCRTHLARRKRRREQSLAAASDVVAGQTPETALEVAEVRRRVHEALQRVPVDQREALVLKYVHGMTLPEMTELLSVTLSALKMRLLRGREALREQLNGVMI